MTPIELRRQGYQVLVENLGQINAIRFLQQVGWGHGDYTKERENLLKSVTRDEFWQDIQKIRNRR
ncbi:MAG: hypothetical protein P5702_13375 [Limnospira sp. PMC 1291.21]|uniref:Uncharacterized protein n=3 Tax=Limnospira TaxID=2596745 RepID=A0A9P1NYD1_9CYAN|nr:MULTISPECIES: hypothetical protein [Limnospira]EKD09873.1 hypothetical protein SPLC1_S131100 [Arthrospira platensis C1]MDC0838930.1 hypothetical protein [Limnoraphis robusta]MDY7051972.1 hypothetical protein [Limnospira fusiformis LS22]QJB28820.1 hypothetical protein HFV01_27180 [Limnospira fusiformis SAG 85.79]RAQ45886.1 hypothetical protein B9S53_06370 [Arthrospira sp. O9.13F]